MSKLTPATLMLGIFAILFGLVGAYAVRRYIAQPETAAFPEPPAPVPRPLTIPVASTNLDAGRPLHLYDLVVLSISPEQYSKAVKEGKYPEQVMANSSQIMGRMLKEPLRKGEAFTADMFYHEGSGPTIAEKLQPGLRAVNILVEGTGVLSEFDGPGSMVDVLFRADAIKEGDVPETTVTLLEGVEVLAVEASGTARGGTSQKQTTLAVTAEQANALKITEGRGTFSLALRNPNDIQIAGVTQPQTLERLLNLPVSEEFTTEIYRGGTSKIHSFPGRSYVPQPTTQLPLAGLLHGRGMQQPASVEKLPGLTPSRTETPPVTVPPSPAPKALDEDVQIPPEPASPASAAEATFNATQPRDQIARSGVFGGNTGHSGTRPDTSRSLLNGHTN